MAVTVSTSTEHGTFRTYRSPVTFVKIGKRWYLRAKTRVGGNIKEITVPVKHVTSVNGGKP